MPGLPLTLIFFSPTRTTKMVLRAMADGTGSESVREWDLTLPGDADRDFPALSEGLAVIGVPVYGGRVPKLAADRLRRITARGVPAVLVATYGNRAVEDALLELRDVVVDLGFRPVAGAEFIGEHSFSTPQLPIAPGRPDESDLDLARAFGRELAARMTVGAFAQGPEPEFPGNRPYRDRTQRPPMSPVVDMDLCTECGACVEVCPSGAIQTGPDSDPKLCLMCEACVRQCPEGARKVEEPFILGAAQKLYEFFSERREPVVYWPDPEGVSGA